MISVIGKKFPRAKYQSFARVKTFPNFETLEKLFAKKFIVAKAHNIFSSITVS